MFEAVKKVCTALRSEVVASSVLGVGQRICLRVVGVESRTLETALRSVGRCAVCLGTERGGVLR